MTVYVSTPGTLPSTPPISPCSDVWKNRPDHLYPDQSFDPKALREEKRKELEQEIRKQVGILAPGLFAGPLFPPQPSAASGSVPLSSLCSYPQLAHPL